MRKHLSLVQTEYLKVLEEIEPDAQVKVTWNIATVSLPVFARSQTPGVSVVVKQKTTKTNREPKSGPAESEGQSVHRISHQRTNSGVIDDSDPRQTGSPVDQASLGMAPNVPRESRSEHLGLGETNPSGENIPLLENGSKQWNIALGEQMVVCSAVPCESDKKDFTPANSETSQDDIQVKPNGVEINNGLKLSAENDKFEPPSVTGVWDSMDISQGLPVTQLADGKMKGGHAILPFGISKCIYACSPYDSLYP